MSSNEKFERDFEAFLQQDGQSELDALYRKLPRPEPDARLDAAVLAMAHRALNPQLVATPHAGVRTSAARRRARWLPALGAAATAVFAIGVALKMGPQWAERGANAPAAPAAARDDGVVHVRALDEPAPAAPPPPASPPPPPQSSAASAPPARQEALRAAPKPSVPPPATVQKSVPAAAAPAPALKAETELGRKELEKVDNVATPSAAPQAFPAQQARQPEMDSVERKQAIAEGAWQRLHDTDAAGGAAAAGAVRNGNAVEEKKPAATAATAPAPEVRAKAAASLSGQASQRSTAAVEEQQAPPADVATVTGAGIRSAPPESASATAPAERAAGRDAKLQQDRTRREAPARSYSAETLRNARLYPESWVAAIQRLIRAGRHDDARENLELFRTKYPSYHLPADVERFAREAR